MQAKTNKEIVSYINNCSNYQCNDVLHKSKKSKLVREGDIIYYIIYVITSPCQDPNQFILSY